MQELENNDSQTQTDESTMQQTSEVPAVGETAPSDAPVGDDNDTDGRPGRTLKLNRSSSDAEGGEATVQSTSTSNADAPAENSADESSGDNGGGRSRRGRQRRGRREPHVPSENPLSLTELKTKNTQELIDMANEMGIENVARSRKQDIIFSILKKHAKSGEDIWGDGVLEILSDGFGFLRSADSSFLAGPDDIYVSPSQIRRFNLRTGDTINGMIRPPKDSERYFALLKVNEVNFESPESAKNKILFENLTPLFPDQRLTLEKGNGSTEDLTGRIIDLCSPIGKGQRGLTHR